MSVHEEQGFTMVELMMALAVMVIVAAAAVPSFRNLQKNMEISAVTAELVGDLNQARSEAITRKADVVIAPLTVGNWAGGWSIVDSGGIALVNRPRNAGRVSVTLTPNTTVDIRFTRDGAIQGWPGSLNFFICDDRSKETGRQLSLSRLGQITNNRIECT